ncbi:MAG: hypothetical protein IJ226_00425 [Clostridia bacterium]|nr:hypothetical protein [Clostridia bacterium]
MYNNETLGKKMAELSNTNVMIIFLLVAFLAFSIGLAFYFLVPGSVGVGIGITMFVVASLIFLIGEVRYFVTKKRIDQLA